MDRTVWWYLDWYAKYGELIETLHPHSLKSLLKRKRPVTFRHRESEIINGLYCLEIMELCTKRQQEVLQFILAGYRIVEIGQETNRDQKNVSQILRRIRKRLIKKGITPETLR
jgi:DNA-binding NarL/FixJ family response regulator